MIPTGESARSTSYVGGGSRARNATDDRRMTVTSDAHREFDALYASFLSLSSAGEVSVKSSRDDGGGVVDLRELARRIAVRRPSTARASHLDDIASTRRPDTTNASRAPPSVARDDRETLGRFLRDEQRGRALAESRARAAEATLLARETEHELALENARLELMGWRERCRQLRSDVPDRWLGVFASYDDEIERLGRENFALQEDLHRALVELMSKEEESDSPSERAHQVHAVPDAERFADERATLRRATRALALERDAMAAKLIDVNRRERQMTLIRAHAEGTTARLARVERLLVQEERRAARADARVCEIKTSADARVRSVRVELANARALIDDLARARARVTVEDIARTPLPSARRA